MRSFLERIKSRKLILSLIAAAVGVVKAYYHDFPDQALYVIVGSLMGYVVVQGVVDATELVASRKTSGEQPIQPATCPAIPDPKIANLVNQLNEVVLELQQMEGEIKT